MREKAFQIRLRTVLSNDELDRIRMKEYSDGQFSILADVHGMSCYIAKRFINNLINIVRDSFKLIVIHGYNHGTAIKEMLANSFVNSRIIEKHVDERNYGMTHIELSGV